jgi:tetratricopeptide (TPR) repeat protein
MTQDLVAPRLGVREAYDALDSYGRAYGAERLRLLLHAAVPQSFRADLLNLIKLNFVDLRSTTDLSIDADVLFSPLVAGNAAGYYRIDPQVRRHCLMLLDSIYREQSERRSVQVARFLLAYAAHAARGPAIDRDPLLGQYLALQRWVALAFTEPTAAAAAFASCLRRTIDLPATAARVSLGGVAAAIDIPLAGHVELLAYARGLDALVSGDSETGNRILRALPDTEMVVGNVVLPSPRAQLEIDTSPRGPITGVARDTEDPHLSDSVQICRDGVAIGSGRLVADNLVLTATDVLAGDTTTAAPSRSEWEVRLTRDRNADGAWSSRSGSVVWFDRPRGLALIRIAASPQQRPRLRLRVAAVTGKQPRLAEARGYAMPSRPDGQDPPTEIWGRLSASDHLSTLLFDVRGNEPESPPPRPSPGMSGGAVLFRGQFDRGAWIYGVVSEVPTKFDGQLPVAQLADAWQSTEFRALLVAAGALDVDAEDPTDPTQIVTTCDDGTAWTWSAPTGLETGVFPAHGGAVLDVLLENRGNGMVIASSDNTTGIWSTEGEQIAILEGHTGRVESAAFSPQGDCVATGSVDCTARIWDAASGGTISILFEHQGAVRSVSFAPDGRRVVTASDDTTAKVWDRHFGALVATLAGHQSAVRSASFSADGLRVVTASDDSSARVWDVANQTLILTVHGHEGGVRDASFSPDGRYVVTASDDHTARISDANTGSLHVALRGHQSAVRTASFSLRSDRVVTASDDGTARVWDTRTGTEIFILGGQARRVERAFFAFRLAQDQPTPPRNIKDIPTGEFCNVSEILAKVEESGQLETDEAIVDQLLIFETERQHTWLVATLRSLVIVLDDPDTRRDRRLVQRVISLSEAQPVTAQVERDGSASVGFGQPNLPRWYYSPTLFATPGLIEAAVAALIVRPVNGNAQSRGEAMIPALRALLVGGRSSGDKSDTNPTGDLGLLQDFLQSQSGLSSPSIRMRFQPDSASFVSAVSALFQEARSGDVILIYLHVHTARQAGEDVVISFDDRQELLVPPSMFGPVLQTVPSAKLLIILVVDDFPPLSSGDTTLGTFGLYDIVSQGIETALLSVNRIAGSADISSFERRLIEEIVVSGNAAYTQNKDLTFGQIASGLIRRGAIDKDWSATYSGPRGRDIVLAPAGSIRRTIVGGPSGTETAPQPNDTASATELINRGRLSRQQGDFAAARQLFENALAVQEKALGPDHLKIAESLTRLGRLLRDQGDPAEALPLFRHALAIHEKLLSPHHPEVAESLNRVGRLLANQGDPAAALPLFRRALEIREYALGPDRPEVAESLTLVGRVAQDEKTFDQALALFQRALDIREKVFGPDHPDVAESLNHIGNLLRDEENSPDALPLFMRALAIQEKTFGPGHPEVAASLNNIGRVYRDSGDLKAALPLFQRALAIREATFGADNPATARSLDRLGRLLRQMRDVAPARELIRRALAVRERMLGPNHSDVAISLTNLGLLERDQGDTRTALPLLERALEIRETAFGLRDPATLRSANRVAQLRQRQRFDSISPDQAGGSNGSPPPIA